MVFEHSTVRGLMDFVGWIHTTPPWNDPPRFFQKLKQVVPFDYCTAFMHLDEVSGKVLASPLTLSNGGGDDISVFTSHNSYFHTFKRDILASVRQKSSFAFHLDSTLAAMLPSAHCAEYRAEFWEKQKIRRSYARYFRTPKGLFSLYLSRWPGRRDYTEEEMWTVDLLAGHFRLLSEHGEDCPSVFIDGRGRIVCREPEGERDLEMNAPLREFLDSRLSEWAGEASGAPFRPLRLEWGENGHRYAVAVVQAGFGRSPLFRVSWNQVQDAPPIPHDVLRGFSRAYHLSPREEDVLGCLVAGKQMKEIAASLDLAVETVKEYLGAIYEKTGTDGRGPLVAKLLNLAFPNILRSAIKISDTSAVSS